MINNLWQCFETTGDIHTYLGFKDYERLRDQQAESAGTNPSLDLDVINEADIT